MGHELPHLPPGSAIASAYQHIWLQLEASHDHQFATAFLTDFAPQIFSALKRLELSANDPPSRHRLGFQPRKPS